MSASKTLLAMAMVLCFFVCRTLFAETHIYVADHSIRKLLKIKEDGTVLWENADYLFRERYELNRNVVEFFSEENPALERLAREFASSLASTVLNR